MGTLFLHIGMPKTGTTAIQRFLSDNRELLEKKGFLYPDFGFVYPGVGVYRNGYFMSRLDGSPYVKEREASYEKLGELAKRHEHIILSDESIWIQQKKQNFWNRMRERLEAMGLSVHLIVYLRRQDLLLESLWNQKVKGRAGMTLTFKEYRKTRAKTVPLRYDKRLDDIRADLRPECLTVKVFERGQLLGGDAIRDFCDIIGFAVTDECVFSEENFNYSFDLDTVEIKRVINQNIVYSDVDDFVYQAIRDYSSKEDMAANSKGISAFSFEKRQAFMEKYNEPNAYVAREYLNRPDGQLFYEPLKNMETIKQWQPQGEALYPAMARVLSATDILLYKRILELERQIDEIKNSIPGKIYRKLRGKRE